MKFFAEIEYVRNGVRGVRYTPIIAADATQARELAKLPHERETILMVEIYEKNEPRLPLAQTML